MRNWPVFCVHRSSFVCLFVFHVYSQKPFDKYYGRNVIVAPHTVFTLILDMCNTKKSWYLLRGTTKNNVIIKPTTKVIEIERSSSYELIYVREKEISHIICHAQMQKKQEEETINSTAARPSLFLI